MESNMGSALTASDVALLSNNNEGFAGNSFLWIFALLILAGGGFGGFGYGNANNQAATTDELSDGFNFSGINNKLNDIAAGVAGVNQNIGNAICSSTYELASKIDNSNCNTQRSVDQVRYDMAVQNGDMKALIHSEGEATRAMIQQNKIEALQAQVNQLQIAQATCGIPKVNPNAWGVYPYTCGAGCNGTLTY